MSPRMDRRIRVVNSSIFSIAVALFVAIMSGCASKTAPLQREAVRLYDEGQYAESILVKLGKTAGGRLGPDKDVAAFNYTCTHQGGPLQGTYQAADKTLGPCPLHRTTFDLTRHGIFIAGQAYQSLPQVLLELDGDDI